MGSPDQKPAGLSKWDSAREHDQQQNPTGRARMGSCWGIIKDWKQQEALSLNISATSHLLHNKLYSTSRLYQNAAPSPRGENGLMKPYRNPKTPFWNQDKPSPERKAMYKCELARRGTHTYTITTNISVWQQKTLPGISLVIFSGTFLWMQCE